MDVKTEGDERGQSRRRVQAVQETGGRGRRHRDERSRIALTRGEAAKSQLVGQDPTAGQAEWGGWGSNPRPADYEETGRAADGAGRRLACCIAPGQTDATGPGGMGQDGAERDECSHNVLTGMGDRRLLNWALLPRSNASARRSM